MWLWLSRIFAHPGIELAAVVFITDALEEVANGRTPNTKECRALQFECNNLGKCSTCSSSLPKFAAFPPHCLLDATLELLEIRGSVAITNREAIMVKLT